MRYVWLLMVALSLEMCSINSSGQTTATITMERQVGEDGYIWYRLKRGNLYGAQDIEGREIVPINYKSVSYTVGGYDFESHDYSHFFRVSDGVFNGVYSREGKYIIPIDKHYVHIELDGVKNRNFIFWKVTKNGGMVGVLDAQGQEVISPSYNHIDVQFVNDERRGHDVNGAGYWFWTRLGGRSGICDLNGKIISEPIYENCCLKRTENGFVLHAFDIIGGKSYTTADIKVNYSSETIFNYDVYDDLFYASEHQRSSVPSSSSPSSSSSSPSSNTPSNNSGNGTTTVVIEHHHDPIPVQQWQACWACGGMGTMGCDNCGGGGTKYIGDRLHRCSRCNGRGIIPCNICYGNKGQYITVYQ